MKPFMSFLKKKSIGKQIVIFSSLLLILCVTILDAIFCFFYYGFHFNKVNSTFEQLASHNYASFEYKADYYRTIMLNISSNTKIRELLLADDLNIVDRSVAIQKEIENLLHNNNNISLTIFPENEKIFFLTPYIQNIENLSKDDWYYKNTTQNKSVFFNNDTFSFIMPIRDISSNAPLNSRIATIKVTLNIEDMFPHNHSFDILIRDDSENIVYNTMADNSLNSTTDLYDKNSFYSKNSNYLIFKKEYFNEQFNLYYIFDYSDSVLSFWNTILLTLCLSIILFLIMFLLINQYTKSITEKVTFILKKMKAYEKGLWDNSNSLQQAEDELMLIDQGLIHMINKLENMINEKYISEIELKNTRLEMLQMQINPHFLYNTLETINKLSISNDMNQIRKISIISQNLGKLFRYNITNNNDIWTSIKNEVTNIRSYIDIQNIRYDNKFDFYTDISPDTEDCIILKFILQPIIENSIKYGFNENSLYGTIYIETFLENDDLYIHIQDDGKGMSNSELSNLLTELEKPSISTNHIGLKNIQRRIQLAFGKKYGITIQSNVDVGTSVYLKLPNTNKPYDLTNNI